jgi:hypothetical protein
MRLVDAAEAAGAAGTRRPEFQVQVNPEATAFLRRFGECGLNVVSVFGGV